MIQSRVRLSVILCSFIDLKKKKKCLFKTDKFKPRGFVAMWMNLLQEAEHDDLTSGPEPRDINSRSQPIAINRSST